MARVAKYVAISCYFVYPSLLRPYIYIKCYSYQLTCQIVLWVGCFIKHLEKTISDLQTTIIMNIIDTTFVMLVTRLLKDFEELLAPYRFFRVHNSHLVNLRYISKFSRSEGGQVVMENGDVVDVSRRRREEFLKYLQQ